MADQHRENDDNNNAGTAWWQPRDDHYDNFEHTPQRRRLRSPTVDPFMPVPGRYAGDGLDYRRPVMTTAQSMGWQADQDRDVRQAAGRDLQEPASATETIDLTGEGDAAEAATSHADNAGSSRAQRLPRFERNIIDIDSSDNEDQPPPRTRDISALPNFDEEDNDSLFIPQVPQRSFTQNFAPIPPRRTTSALRRPGFMRQPSPAMPLDDVEVVGSRPISRVQSRRQTPNLGMQAQRSITPFPGEIGNDTIDLTQDDDDDLVLTHARARLGVNGDRPAMAGTGAGVRDEPELYGGRGIGHLTQLLRRHGRELPAFMNPDQRPYAMQSDDELHRNLEQARQRRREAEYQLETLRDRLGMERTRNAMAQRMMNRPPARPAPRATVLPGAMMMNFETAAFDLGFGMQRPPTPKYEPPPPAEDGFTRNPEEEEVVVCPNCGDELAMGDTDLKQQVWVVKGCGHVSSTNHSTYTVHQVNVVSRHTVATAPRTAPKSLEATRPKSRAKARARCRITCRFRRRSRSVWLMAVGSRCRSLRWFMCI